jgi:proteasome lid subunit RPN8/RPN11
MEHDRKAPMTREDSKRRPDEEKLSIGPEQESRPVVYRPFPGPKGAEVELRVAIDREAYADLVVHAKGSLEKEVCGILAGEVCEDEEGTYVWIHAALEGESARQGSTHVTFTQQTWTTIHARLEAEFPRMQIVGWYHTHPGFGVEFSEMDLFIQRHFFSAPTQIALVSDPLGGDEAVCINTSGGIRYIDRFWVDGRERRCRVPRAAGGRADTAAPALAGSGEEALAKIETRLGQLIQTLDADRARHSRFLMSVGMFAGLCVVGLIGYSFYQLYRYRVDPPQLRQYLPVPIRVGDSTVMLGVGIAEWKVPDEVRDAYLEAELLKRQAAEEARRRQEEARRDRVRDNTETGRQPGAQPPANR